jgi:hypothetical protein
MPVPGVLRLLRRGRVGISQHGGVARLSQHVQLRGGAVQDKIRSAPPQRHDHLPGVDL